jgi:iron complex transport system ATP-binding protein
MNDFFQVEHTQDYVYINLPTPSRVLSSAVLNGGMQTDISHILNLKVGENFSGDKKNFEAPDTYLDDFCDKMKWNGKRLGMMTSASMNSFQQSKRSEQGVDISVLITAGVSNARRAGDVADWNLIGDQVPEFTGTINIIGLTNACLTEAAMVEALMIITEAKAAVMENYSVKSRVSNLTATGTGTDSAAIASVKLPESKYVKYTGKHVRFGELLAQAVIESLSASLDRIKTIMPL